MSPKRTYFGYSTPQQRKLLFETWEASQSVTEACRITRLSRGTFYHWKARFDQEGCAGLEQYASRAHHELNKKSPAIERQVIEMRRGNPDWGKTKIANEMAKANNWVPVVSPNTVKRILKDAKLWPESGAGEKRSS